MLSNMHQANEAHDLLKDSLASQSSNLNLRAYYTYFLIQSNASRPAREFVFGTLRDHDKHDLYALCAAGWLHYHQARESRDMSAKGVEERRVFFRRSAEFYEKALGLDPFCAVAAQGLAIVTAEDALGTLGGVLPPGPAPDEGQRRAMNARDALEVFAKVRESTNDGSVYVNMGHCYFARDEFDRAIESVRACLFVFVCACVLTRRAVRDGITALLWWAQHLGVAVLGTVVVRQGEQGTVVRVDDGRVAIHTKGTAARHFSSGRLLTSVVRFRRARPGAAHAACGQSDRVQHRDDPAKIRRTALLSRAGEALARGAGTRHRAGGARAEDVRVARGGCGGRGAVRPRPGGGAQKVRGQHAATRGRAPERAAAVRGGAGCAAGRGATEAGGGAGAHRVAGGALLSRLFFSFLLSLTWLLIWM